GEGAFGTIFRAQDDRLGREVAIKLLRLDGDQETPLIESLLKEARAAAKLSHPSIVTVHDCGHLEDGGYFVVFEFVPGGHLGHELLSGNVSVERAVELMIQISDGAHHAHSHGLYHRDLKPANILIAPDTSAKITDFGIVLAHDQQFESRGEVTGTPLYMSPEQTRGESHLLDGRSDIWSMGVILYEILSGKRPFCGHTREALFESIQRQSFQPLRQVCDSVPSELEAICRKCLRKDPDQRYSTAEDLANDLRIFQRGWLTKRKTNPSRSFQATGSFQAIRKTPVAPERIHSPPPSAQSQSTSRSPQKKVVTAVLLAVIALAFWASELFDRQNPGKPDGTASSRPVALLTQPPQVFAWARDPNVMRPLFDRKLEAYCIQKTAGHLFAVAGKQPASPMLVKTTLNIDQNWTGSAGILWGLRITNNQFQRQEQKCFSLCYSRYREGKQPRLKVDELTFTNPDGVEWKHSYTRPLDEIEVRIPTGNMAILTARIEKQTLTVMFDNDQVWNPQMRKNVHTTWLPGEGCAMGITGRGNMVVISNLQVEPILP
ncbi:MAG: serine/threonine-protein kinase, partial [Planctomycetaceae bacterium]